MKKIPTLFVRKFEGRKIVDVMPEITPGCEEAFALGDATVKVGGCCCAIIDGKFYKRYDAKHGKKPPKHAIPCCEPDPITGHWPHWELCDKCDPANKWFFEALNDYMDGVDIIPDGTYEAIGPHMNANPYNLVIDTLVPHGKEVVMVERDFASIKEWLETHNEEGLVFWYKGEPVCKIKRSDFGLPWPVEK